MIGLLDLDLQTSTSIFLCPPNLEIMKLATYYRYEENLFCNLISLSDTVLEGYETIYCFSEAYQPKIPDILKKQSNVIYGGTGFTNGVYKPFENEIIDYTLPKTWIYKNFLKQKYDDGIKTKVINSILDSTYYRCYAGNNKLPMPPIYPRKKLYIYDTEFFKEGWEDIIQQADDRKVSGIHFIHPIFCKTLTQYFKLREYTKVMRSNIIILDTNIPLIDVSYMLRKYKNYFLADITTSSNVFLPLGGTLQTNLQYYNDLIYKLNLLYSFWAQGIPMKFKYIPPTIGVSTNIANLLTEITHWSQLKHMEHTINDKIIRKTFKSAAEEEKAILLKFHPEAKDLFTQSYADLSKRGVWRI